MIPAEQLINRAEQAFGGRPFTVKELVDYLKAPGEMSRIEKAVRRATIAGLLIRRPRGVDGKVQIEHVPANSPRAPGDEDASVKTAPVAPKEVVTVDEAHTGGAVKRLGCVTRVRWAGETGG